MPSRRRLHESPIAYFVTSCFPRGDGWSRRWRARLGALNRFDTRMTPSKLRDETILQRQMHGLFLFGILPI